MAPVSRNGICPLCGSNAAPGSAGIGLALAAELVRAQGGSVVAENQTPGPGARFILKLPIHPGSL